MAESAVYLQARVIQKVATEAEWQDINLDPLIDGELYLYRDVDGTPRNFKIGDGVNQPRDIPYFFDASIRVPFFGTATPSSTPSPASGDGFWIATEAGTYTNYGGVVLPANSFGIITRVGTTYGILIATIDLSGLAQKNEVVLKTDLDISGTASLNLLDPSNLLIDEILVCSGAIGPDTYGDAKCAIVTGIEGGQSYYIGGRAVRTGLRFYDINGNGLPATNGANFCSGTAEGFYIAPANAVSAIVVTFFGGAGTQPENVMMVKTTTVPPEFIPYVPTYIERITSKYLAAKVAEDRNGDLKTVQEIIDDDKPETFVIEQGSNQLFDKDNHILYGFSLSNTGNPVESTGSSMSKDIPIDPSKGEFVYINGRSVRRPFVFLTSTGEKIPSSFGADYNAGPLNGAYPLPSNAAAFRFAISYLGDGEGSENVIMVNYGDQPLPYEPYKPTAVVGIKINGVTYPLAAEGGDTPSSSSFKFQGVKLTEDELIIISKYSDSNNLKTLFKVTGNNNTYLLNSQGKITRDENGIYEPDFDKSISINLLRWDGTDGIGPYQLNNSGGSVGFVGGNHGQPEPANPTPPYYDYQTSKCLTQEFWADGIKINPGDIVDAKIVRVKVVNEVYNLDGILQNNPPQFIVDFHEIQEYVVIDGKVIIDVTLVAVQNISLKTVYSLQMQIGAGLEKIYFPHSLYNSVETRTVNPTSGDRPYGTKQDFPNFEKFIAMTTNQQDCSCAWIDITKGLGTRSNLQSTSTIARGKQIKLYHNVLDIATPLAVGESVYYEGGVNIFKNLAGPANNTFAYYQYEKGDTEWEYKKYLICDFAGTVSGRSIIINYQDLIGKTLQVEIKDSTVNVPPNLTVTEAGVEIVCTGHGNVKFLIL